METEQTVLQWVLCDLSPATSRVSEPMPNIAVTLPDGNQMQVESGTTALAVAEQISPGLARGRTGRRD